MNSQAQSVFSRDGAPTALSSINNRVVGGCGFLKLLLTPGRSATTTSWDVGCGFVYESLTFAKRIVIKPSGFRFRSSSLCRVYDGLLLPC